jgi:hypothetical protein
VAHRRAVEALHTAALNNNMTSVAMLRRLEGFSRVFKLLEVTVLLKCCSHNAQKMQASESTASVEYQLDALKFAYACAEELNDSVLQNAAQMRLLEFTFLHGFHTDFQKLCTRVIASV